MSQTVVPAYEPAPNRARWTRGQCDAMVEAGLLQGRYELIDGEILSKMGRKPLHIAVVVLVSAWLKAVFGDLYVRNQATIDVEEVDPDYNAPEPDVAVTEQPITAYIDRYAGPDDLLVVVEVSDTTLRFDLNAKAALYALAGIREYWVVDVAGRRVVAHRLPAPTGYGEVTIYTENQEI